MILTASASQSCRLATIASRACEAIEVTWLASRSWVWRRTSRL
jgi:hypothetical protein